MDVVATLLTIAAVLLATLYVVRSWVRSAKLRCQINKLPGPPTYPIIGTTYKFLGAPKNGVLKLLGEMIKTYGPVLRFWIGTSPEVILVKPQHFEAIITSSKHLDKSGFYKFMVPLLGTGLVTSTGQKWHSHRKLITPTFHLSILDTFLEVFSEKCEILMDKLQQKADGSGFDIAPYITRCALDIICETAMGVSIYAQEDADSEYVRTVSEAAELIVYRRNRVWLHPDFIFYNAPSGRRFKECLAILQGFTKRVIQERKAALSNAIKISHESSDEDRSFGIRRKKAFLDLLLEVSQKEGKFSDEEIREEVDTFMAAGHDTTATSTSWTLFMLGHHPEIQEKVYEELSEIFQGSERSPTMKDLHEMKYMERVIKETLRVYPTIPIIQRVLNEDLTIDGYDVPAGTNINILICYANLNPEYFPNPEEFNPDNFLPERVQKRHPYAFIPFSAGPRNCIGQKFALLEEKTMLSYILRKFKIRSLDKREDMTALPHIVLKPEHGVKVALTPRT